MHPDQMPVEPDEPEHEPEPAIGPSHCACWDCGRAYGDEYGFPDLNVPHDVWRVISATGHEGGLLCPSCLCRRLHNAGLKNVPVHFGSGPCAHTDFRASNAELLEALKEVTDDAEAEIRSRYQEISMHSAMRKRMERDLAGVNRARELLAKHERTE